MITPVGAEAAQWLAALHASAFAPAELWSATVIALQLNAPGGFGYADHRGGMILGRAIAGEAEVLTLAVSPRLRRSGIGRGLLDKAITHARQEGATALFLEVSVANTPALALYESAGFTTIGQRRGYYTDGTDALVMRLNLPAT
jgi:ribosomal-protein-alanine N-acetyltransferase